MFKFYLIIKYIMILTFLLRQTIKYKKTNEENKKNRGSTVTKQCLFFLWNPSQINLRVRLQTLTASVPRRVSVCRHGSSTGPPANLSFQLSDYLHQSLCCKSFFFSFML
jgi:hypothetical protein